MAAGVSITPTGLNKQVHQGYFAEGLVASIAAAAGLDVNFPRLGHGLDLGVYKPGPKGTSSSRQMILQVKSWSAAELKSDGHFHYPMEVSAYNFLAGRGHEGRHYLVLCTVPGDAHQYADAQESRLALYRSAYWLSLRDREPNPSLNPDRRVIVHVPRTNLLTPVTILALVNNQEEKAVVP